MNTPIYIVGDTHGEWDALFRKIGSYEINNCYLLHVGDIGIGFKIDRKQKREIELLNDRFKSRDIRFKGIRGNHDDPAWFDGKIKESHFELLPDYTSLELSGKSFLFVGGAVSIDRRVRSPNISWWEGEQFEYKPELVQPCDVLVTHTSPTWSGEFTKAGIASWCNRDPALWDECVVEREGMSKLIEACGASKHYCGHFHVSYSTSYNGCDSRILDILEIKEIL